MRLHSAFGTPCPSVPWAVGPLGPLDLMDLMPATWYAYLFPQVLTLLLTQQQLLGELHARTQRLEAELLSQAATLRRQEQEAATLRSVLCGQQGLLADQPWCSNDQAAGEAVAGSGAAVAAAEGQAGQSGGKGKRQGKGGRRPPRESPSGE